MTVISTKRVLLCGMALLMAAWPAAAGTRVDRTFDLAPGGAFLLDAANGNVTVTGVSGSQARVIITSREDDLEDKYEIRFDSVADRLEVEVEKKGRLSSWFGWNRGLKFEIEVPTSTNVSIDTAGGSIEVEQLEGNTVLDTSGGAIRARQVVGPVNADTSGGSIELEHIDGDVNADTSGGSIEIARVTGQVRADTSGGSIRLDEIGGDIHADTSGGSIRIAEAGGYVRADTSGGSVHVSFAAGNSSGGELGTSGGRITVVLDPGVNLDIDASASGGSVQADLPVTVQGRISKSTLQGKIGAGGNRLKLRASGGPIRIEPR